MLSYEKRLRDQGCSWVFGVDEAGRGPLAGPVVAAAVWLRQDRFSSRIDDSKKLTAAQRLAAFEEISRVCVYGVGVVNERVIDRVNILAATHLAMEQAVAELAGRLGIAAESAADADRVRVLVDGPIRLRCGFQSVPIVGGDALSLSIAAASIVAKVLRDRIMDIYDRILPGYGFSRHRGYPTGRHRQALRSMGKSFLHRRTFAGV